jgi:TPR repeat protein
MEFGTEGGGPARGASDPQEADTAALATRLLQSGRMLLASGDELAACDALEAAARLGNVDAAYMAAVALLGSSRADPDRALELLRYAAGQGSKEAALMLGKILWSTQGAQHEGVELLRAAAAAGEAEALHFLGLACFRGQGVAKDPAAARELQIAAARRGLPDAQFELSLMLAQGLGGDVDIRAARRWEAMAAEAGHPRACLNRGAQLANRKRPDWAKVAHWYARAAAAGNAEAAARLGAMTDAESNSSLPELLPAEIALMASKPGGQFESGKDKPTGKPVPMGRDARFSTLLVAANGRPSSPGGSRAT